MTQNYRLFGLTVSSEIALDESIRTDAVADVEIVFGTCPSTIPNVLFEGVRFLVSENEFLLKVDRIAKYHVIEGRKIRIERMPEATDDEVRLFLLSSAFGALVHQRGMLPIHGSAVIIDGKGVIFAGVSGAGKSTLANAMIQRGYQPVADDMCVIDVSADSKAILHPGYPVSKLWADALDKLDKKTSDYKPVRASIKKFNIPLKAFANTPIEISTIYKLVPHNLSTIEIKQLKGIEKFNCLNVNTFRFSFIQGIKATAKHFDHITALSAQCVVKQIKRPNKEFKITELVDLILSDLC